jgi:hypothetical protein
MILLQVLRQIRVTHRFQPQGNACTRYGLIRGRTKNHAEVGYVYSLGVNT